MPDADAATLAELRRRIQGSFSPGELRSLGAALGFEPDPSWDRGADATVRDVVRRALEGPGLYGLVEELKREKPLVEWDDLLPPARGGDTAAGSIVPELGPLPTISELDSQPTIVDAPAVLDLTPPPLPEVADAPAPPAAELAPPSEAAARAPAGVAAAPPSSGGAAWPMQNLASASDAPKRGLEPRLVAITAACIALAIAVAFVAGIVWSRQGRPAEAATGTRSTGLAGQAATAVDGALIDVARGCGLEVPQAPGRDLLRAAQAQCGHPVSVAGRPPRGFDPNEIEPPKLDGGPKTVRRPVSPGGGAATPKAPVDPCRDTCKAERNTCKGGCGDEPRDASEFEAWQACNGKCIAAESKCRQRCK